MTNLEIIRQYRYYLFVDAIYGSCLSVKFQVQVPVEQILELAQEHLQDLRLQKTSGLRGSLRGHA